LYNILTEKGEITMKYLILYVIFFTCLISAEEIKLSKKIKKVMDAGQKLKPRQLKKIKAQIKQQQAKHIATKKTSRRAKRGLKQCRKALKMVKLAKITKVALKRIPA
jgi:hypothetical protein